MDELTVLIYRFLKKEMSCDFAAKLAGTLAENIREGFFIMSNTDYEKTYGGERDESFEKEVREKQKKKY